MGMGRILFSSSKSQALDLRHRTVVVVGGGFSSIEVEQEEEERFLAAAAAPSWRHLYLFPSLFTEWIPW